MDYYIKNLTHDTQKGIDEIYITNDDTEISLINHGARINRWLVNGNENIVLGSENVANLFTDDFKFFGATIGRVAGRINNAEFNLKNEKYILDKNEKDNHHHGGHLGYNDVIWDYKLTVNPDSVTVSFFYKDTDGMNGYPGTVTVQVDYTYNRENKLTIAYHAITDKDTLFSPTNHVYFNLSGNNTTSILDHELTINSDQFLPLQTDGIPTGEFLDVTETPFDFRTKQSIRMAVHSDHAQIIDKKGLDHPFVLNKNQKTSAKLSFHNHTINMTTDRNAVVVYTMNNTSDDLTVWQNPLKPYHGIALEAQDFPDSINLDIVSDSLLLKGQPFMSTTTYQYINKEIPV